MQDDIKEILNHLIYSPNKNEIVVDFNLEKKIFSLHIPIYVAQRILPNAIKKYISARINHIFKPHSTTFQIEEDRKVMLMQQIPFRWGFDVKSHQEMLDFLRLAQRCHQMLYEIALEEKYKEALHHLDSDS
ncbi:MAG TPA: hypothetical protein VLE95_07775 [Chlamydiales bacterium]|nr:hypothetical protein [Chlamydiales bacterium]